MADTTGVEDTSGTEEDTMFDIVADYNSLSRKDKIEVLTQLSRRCRALANLHSEFEHARTEAEQAAIAYETEQASLHLVQLLAEYNIAIPNSEFFGTEG